METEKSKGYSKGLEGVVAGETRLSFVNGEEGKLFYYGIPIGEFIQGNATFEEVTYLLWYGKLPSAKELSDFSKELARNREIPPELHSFIAAFPKKSHPMAVLRSAVSLLGLYDAEAEDNSREANVRKGMRILAQIPTIVASFDRMRRGKKPLAPREELSHAANFLYLLNENVPSAGNAKALDQYLVMLADHGFNASTFAARVTVSTLSDIYSGIATAVGTLKGDLHGSANQRAMEMIREVGEVAKAESYVLALFAQKKKVMGFGHRIYKHEDPRAVIFKAITKKVCEGRPEFESYYKISEKIEEVVTREKQIPCNVDFYSASLLYAVGISIDLFAAIFALSRIAGWTAHILEQQEDNRLIRPEVIYTGPANQPYTPIASRK